MRKSIKILAGLLISLLLVLIIGPFLIPIAPLEGTVPPRQLADPDSRFIELLDVEVHYKIAGAGEPVFILLHGFGSSEFSWQVIFDEIASFGTVIAYDRPAFGLTERPLAWEGHNPYGPDFQVDLVLAIMDAFSFERAILVGNSAGGAIAMNAYLQAPERIEALALVDPAVYAGGGTPTLLRPLLRLPQFSRLGPLFTRNIRNWGLDFAASAWHDPSKITAEIWEGYTRLLQVDNWDIALWELTKASRASNLPNQLNEFRLPVLVITGDDDRIVPTADSIRLAAELPTAELMVIENCGHVPHEECPDEFMSAFSNFIQAMTK
jgi:pimeloyl-ACP methyl ester carboxylesterase